MKLNALQMRKISNLYHDYVNISDDKDLHKRNLSLSDYRAVEKLILDIQKQGHTKTFLTAVANYFEKFEFIVSMDKNNVNYLIALKNEERSTL